MTAAFLTSNIVFAAAPGHDSFFFQLGFDDNAKYRQKEIFDMEDTTESDPREVEAASFNLNYVQVRTRECRVHHPRPCLKTKKVLLIVSA